MASVNGSFLKQHREDPLDLSQEEAAGLLQISSGYLRNIENGYDSGKVSRRLVGRIARVYRIDREDFVIPEAKDDEDEKEKTPDPSHPTRRQDKEKTTGPKRDRGQAEASVAA